MIIIIAVITKGISNDKWWRVIALEAEEPSDTLKCWEALSSLKAIKSLPGMTKLRGCWLHRALGMGIIGRTLGSEALGCCHTGGCKGCTGASQSV